MNHNYIRDFVDQGHKEVHGNVIISNSPLNTFEMLDSQQLCRYLNINVRNWVT